LKEKQLQDNSKFEYVKEQVEEKQSSVKVLKPSVNVAKDKSLSPKAIEKQIAKVEKDIINKEEEITSLEDKLADTEFYQKSPEEFVLCSSKLDDLKLELDSLNDRWAELIEMQ
ncbi:MAG: hypothetical protein AB7V50_11590, partial [Vampirovibrionia bacterium]